MGENVRTSAQKVERTGSYFIQLVGRVRACATFWIAPPSMEHLESIRLHELEAVLKCLPSSGKLLEVGAGTGWQSRALSARGYEVSAIDLAGAKYSDQRVWPIIEYDGQTIPFAKDTFDIVFSSNVLEHIAQISDFERELLRVLKDDGIAVHVLPSGSWRFWTNLTHVLKRWSIPNVHGATARNCLSEIVRFTRRSWNRHFLTCGWQVVSAGPSGLFYTGHCIIDKRLGLRKRARLSRILGSSCNIFFLKKGTPNNESAKDR